MYSEKSEKSSLFRYQSDLEKVLEEFDISREDICIIGSTALTTHGIRENDDVDFLTTPEIRDRLREEISEYPDCKIRVNGAIHFGEHIELSPPEHYGPLGISDRETVENSCYHDIVDGYKILRLELVLSKKYVERRPKDLRDVRLIEESGLIGSDDWDWGLVKPLPPWEWSRSQAGLIERGLLSLKNDGLVETALETLSFLSEYVSVIPEMPSIYQHQQTGRQLSALREQGLEFSMPIPGVLLGHCCGNRFSGWDLVISYLKLENELDIDLSVFEEAELEAGSKPVKINKNGKAINGKRRIVEAIRAGEPVIPVEVAEDGAKDSANRATGDTYDDQWLHDSFDKATVEVLRRRRHELFEQCGTFFYAVIWPTMRDRFDEVERYLRERATVVDTTVINLDDDFERFVRNLYTADEYAKDWTIEKKLRGMDQGPIRILTLKILNPEIRHRESGAVSKTANRLKTDCRRSFQSKIDNYVYDNIIHISDNYRQNRHVYQLIEAAQSGNLKSSEYSVGTD